MRKFKAIVAVAIAACLSAPVLADEVVLSNGDHITGKIDGTQPDGKVQITSTLIGKVEIDPKDIKTFSTDEAVVLQLSDGTVLHQKIAAGPDGQVTTAAGGTMAQQNVALASVTKINPPAQVWTGNVVVGGFLSRGNSDIDSLNAAAHGERRTDLDRLTLDAGYNYSRQKAPGQTDKTRSVDNWFVEGKYDYFLSKKLYAYGDVRVERDLIADLNLRLTPGVGVGYQWFEDPTALSFNTEAGFSWLYRDYRNGTEVDKAALRLAYHLKYHINDTFTVFHDMEYFPGLDEISDFYFSTDAGIHASITENLFSEFRIDLRHDNRPAPGFEKDDTRYTLGVGWKF